MATVKDVADLAGVSTATVSRVLNNHSHVTDETRSKVLWAMDELGYQPKKKPLDIQLRMQYNIAVENDIMISFSTALNLTTHYLPFTKCPRGSNCQQLRTSLNGQVYPQ